MNFKQTNLKRENSPWRKRLLQSVPVTLSLVVSICSTSTILASSEPVISPIVQQGEVAKGVVIDANGEPIIGATVVVKGTTNGVVTDLDGAFSLNNVEKGAIIEISFVGYTTQTVTWKGQNLNVTLKDDNQVLDEVVVVGYGTQKKVNVTGAVGMVDSKVLAARPVTNVAQALQGTVPGLNFTVGSEGGTLDGEMSFNIRGAGTIGDGSGSSPLVLIDGIEGSLNSLNPNDIESVSVLKDAASASIYGARGAFGVILVQTKKGSQGKSRVNYSANVRFSDAVAVPDMMDSYTFAQYFNRAAENVGAAAAFSPEAIQRIQDYQAGKLTTVATINENTGRWNNYTGSNANTNWFKEFYNDWVPSQEHNLSISGGNEKIQYSLSGSFMDQNGLLRHGKDNLKRYTLNSNITANVTDWFQVSYSTKWTRTNFDRPSYLTGEFFHNIARRWPTCPAYDPNGFPMDGVEIIQLEDGGRQLNEKDLNTQQLKFVFEPIKNWTINIEGALRTENNHQHWDVLPVYAHDVEGNPYPIVWGSGYSAGASRVNEYNYKENYYSTNIYSDYFKQFENGHYFKVMVGFNSELYKTRNINARKNTLISNSVPTINTATESPDASGGYAHNAVAGFFGRINYNYKDRYMVELNGRYDGSSRFIGDKRWGFFPSFSLGWNVVKEDFFQDIAEKANINMLKLRGSWGQLGNTDTRDQWYPFFATMPQGSNYNWLVNGKRPNYASLPGIVSSLKTWETIETWDIGLDWGFFNNRLTGSFDYFVRWTYDMIGPAPELPSILGATPPKINNADMKSYGFEIELGWRDRIGDFSYGAKVTLADDQQKITRYPNENLKLSEAYYPGKMRGEIWGYETIGIAQSQEEMDAHLAKVDQSALGSKWGAGDIMYADLDGDGVITSGENTVINPGDRKIIGNNTPRYKYGITLDAAWKGIDFRVFFQGVGKRDYWMNGPYFWGANGVGLWQGAGFKEHWDFWRPEGDPLGANTDAYYPRVLRGDSRNMAVQDRYIQNAAYCRIKNIQIGYTLPSQWTSKVGMSSVRIYVSGDNLLTFSKMSSIFDPEALESTYDSNNGKLYPLQRTISVGLNVNF